MVTDETQDGSRAGVVDVGIRLEMELEAQLPADEVDTRLAALAVADRRVDAALCFYLLEVDRRELYRHFGFASTADYVRERFGFERRKTQSLLYMSRRFAELPAIEARFREGALAWTKAREIVKVATEATEQEWIEKADLLSNRQLEEAVRSQLPSPTQYLLRAMLNEERAQTWVQVKEALSRMAGKNLSDLETLDVMFAEVLCTYAMTPPMGPPDQGGDDDHGGPDDERGTADGDAEARGGYAAKVVERDGFQCTRPGCSSRTALTANHIVPRGRGGGDEAANLHLVCLPCHQAITRGQLTVRGRAPDELTWEGPCGAIERPLPLSAEQVDDRLKAMSPPPPESPSPTPPARTSEKRPNGREMAEMLLGRPSEGDSRDAHHGGSSFAQEPRTPFGREGGPRSRSRDREWRDFGSMRDHVIAKEGATHLGATGDETPRARGHV